jgi:regulatory protein
LSLRDRTEQEVRAHLQEKGFPTEAVEEALSKLRGWRYLDDARVALAMARDRTERSHWGPARLARELEHHGVSPAVAEEVLRKIMDGSNEERLASAAAQRYLRTHPGTLGDRGMRRLAGFLGRRGFSGEVIGRVVKRHLNG